jgi:hypothetical protein
MRSFTSATFTSTSFAKEKQRLTIFFVLLTSLFTFVTFPEGERIINMGDVGKVCSVLHPLWRKTGGVPILTNFQRQPFEMACLTGLFIEQSFPAGTAIAEDGKQCWQFWKDMACESQ